MPLYFLYSFVNYRPILIIIGTQHQKQTRCKRL